MENTEGEEFVGGNISPWDISCFKFVRNFPHNFQAAVQINALRNLAKCLVQQLPEHKSVVPFHKS